jgi:hypothetical protein
MIHAVVMGCLMGLPLLIHIELLRRSRSFKNRESESKPLCIDPTALLKSYKSASPPVSQMSLSCDKFQASNRFCGHRHTDSVTPCGDLFNSVVVMT